MLDTQDAVKVVLAWEQIPVTAIVMNTATVWVTAAMISLQSAKLVSLQSM